MIIIFNRKHVKTKKINHFFISVLVLVICVSIFWKLLNQKSVILDDVPYINQKYRYPTGCESVSTVMALNYLGIDITVDEFINNYLDMEPLPTANLKGKMVGYNPEKAFIGNPYSQDGYGCYASVIVNAVNKFIDNTFEVQELHNKPIEELCNKYIDKGIPVIFWATIDMRPPQAGDPWIDKDTGKRVVWIVPMHCLLLIGYDKDFYYFNDPLQKKMCSYKKSKVKAAYKGMHKQAVVIKKAS